MKRCPLCAEEIQDAAVVCHHCGGRYGADGTWRLGPARGGARTNGLAIASMVLGIVWMYGVTSILALVFGYKARRQINESGGAETGAGFATAGIVLGWVGVVGMAVMVTIFAIVLTQTPTADFEYEEPLIEPYAPSQL